ncbi:hypothetical protein G6F46_004576 [Rhizopus delemar]|nr:hypothetical protein G6F55_005403 [Rhizopus delemar]KAG1544132.1 hypothetical protein G6F51_006252 [Rhizopus arrhizus]KAG1494204.1 hypothetical protein G6F54_008045 [Rhizopus delemar]KAG1508284.1 hypothetical protein G6F53_008310 [Rhizopus delemar]KAG1519977.1 hypothetical protein G6F52_008104 [Rhizopus delemar]
MIPYAFTHICWLPLLSLPLAYVFIYCRRRYGSSLASVVLAPTDNFITKYLGLVPPPNHAEKTDELSRFLIRAGQDPRYFPVSVCWSLTGKPLVIASTLKGIKDVLLDGQMKSKVRGEQQPKVQRGNMIRLIHNLVFGGKSLNNVIGEDWRWRRHVLLPPFQPKQLVPKLLPYVASRTAELLSTFEKYAENGSPVELDNLFMDATMDIINYYLYGRNDLNYDIVGGRTNMKFIHNHLGYGFQSLEAWLPFGINKTNWAQKRFKPSRDLLKRFVEDSLKYALEDYEADLKRFEQENVPVNERSYQSVAACAFASGFYGKDQFDLINDLLALTFAGYDTTAHTLAFAFSELARDSDLQDKVFQQVRQVLGPPPLSPSSITAEKLAKMPLVTAVYRETLRKYPAVVFIPVHVNRDTVVDGVIVPEGAEIWCNVRGIQMNPQIFPEPNRFDPIRWLQPDNKGDNAFDNMHGSSSAPLDQFTPETQYKFPEIAFTLGQHSCLGKNLAILELRMVIACTINQFTFELKEGCHIDTKIVLTTKPRNGVWVHFKKRKS